MLYNSHILVNEIRSAFYDFERNQYIVAHHDTGHQHIHIVANRVSFDGKTPQRTIITSGRWRKNTVCRK